MKMNVWLWIAAILGLGLIVYKNRYKWGLMTDPEEFKGGGYGFRNQRPKGTTKMAIASDSGSKILASKRQIVVEPREGLVSESAVFRGLGTSVGGGSGPAYATDQCFCQPAGTTNISQAYIGDCPCKIGDRLRERIDMTN